MSLRSYLILMFLATAMCWLGFGFTLFTINPESTNNIGFTLFYSSLFLSLIGTSAIAGFMIRFVGMKKVLASVSVREAFRQSFLFTSFIIVTLFLLSQDLFSWGNLILLVLGLSVLEFFMLGYNSGVGELGDDKDVSVNS